MLRAIKFFSQPKLKSTLYTRSCTFFFKREPLKYPTPNEVKVNKSAPTKISTNQPLCEAIRALEVGGVNPKLLKSAEALAARFERFRATHSANKPATQVTSKPQTWRYRPRATRYKSSVAWGNPQFDHIREYSTYRILDFWKGTLLHENTYLWLCLSNREFKNASWCAIDYPSFEKYYASVHIRNWPIQARYEVMLRGVYNGLSLGAWAARRTVRDKKISNLGWQFTPISWVEQNPKFVTLPAEAKYTTLDGKQLSPALRADLSWKNDNLTLQTLSKVGNWCRNFKREPDSWFSGFRGHPSMPFYMDPRIKFFPAGKQRGSRAVPGSIGQLRYFAPVLCQDSRVRPQNTWNPHLRLTQAYALRGTLVFDPYFQLSSYNNFLHPNSLWVNASPDAKYLRGSQPWHTSSFFQLRHRHNFVYNKKSLVHTIFIEAAPYSQWLKLWGALEHRRPTIVPQPFFLKKHLVDFDLLYLPHLSLFKVTRWDTLTATSIASLYTLKRTSRQKTIARAWSLSPLRSTLLGNFFFSKPYPSLSVFMLPSLKVFALADAITPRLSLLFSKPAVCTLAEGHSWIITHFQHLAPYALSSVGKVLTHKKHQRFSMPRSFDYSQQKTQSSAVESFFFGSTSALARLDSRDWSSSRSAWWARFFVHDTSTFPHIASLAKKIGASSSVSFVHREKLSFMRITTAVFPRLKHSLDTAAVLETYAPRGLQKIQLPQSLSLYRSFFIKKEVPAPVVPHLREGLAHTAFAYAFVVSGKFRRQLVLDVKNISSLVFTFKRHETRDFEFTNPRHLVWPRLSAGTWAFHPALRELLGARMWFYSQKVKTIVLPDLALLSFFKSKDVGFAQLYHPSIHPRTRQWASSSELTLAINFYHPRGPILRTICCAPAVAFPRLSLTAPLPLASIPYLHPYLREKFSQKKNKGWQLFDFEQFLIILSHRATTKSRLQSVPLFKPMFVTSYLEKNIFWERYGLLYLTLGDRNLPALNPRNQPLLYSSANFTFTPFTVGKWVLRRLPESLRLPSIAEVGYVSHANTRTLRVEKPKTYESYARTQRIPFSWVLTSTYEIFFIVGERLCLIFARLLHFVEKLFLSFFFWWPQWYYTVLIAEDLKTQRAQWWQRLFGKIFKWFYLKISYFLMRRSFYVKKKWWGFLNLRYLPCVGRQSLVHWSTHRHFIVATTLTRTFRSLEDPRYKGRSDFWVGSNEGKSYLWEMHYGDSTRGGKELWGLNLKPTKYFSYGVRWLGPRNFIFFWIDKPWPELTFLRQPTVVAADGRLRRMHLNAEVMHSLVKTLLPRLWFEQSMLSTRTPPLEFASVHSFYASNNLLLRKIFEPSPPSLVRLAGSFMWRSMLSGDQSFLLNFYFSRLPPLAIHLRKDPMAYLFKENLPTMMYPVYATLAKSVVTHLGEQASHRLTVANCDWDSSGTIFALSLNTKRFLRQHGYWRKRRWRLRRSRFSWRTYSDVAILDPRSAYLPVAAEEFPVTQFFFNNTLTTLVEWRSLPKQHPTLYNRFQVATLSHSLLSPWRLWGSHLAARYTTSPLVGLYTRLRCLQSKSVETTMTLSSLFLAASRRFNDHISYPWARLSTLPSVGLAAFFTIYAYLEFFYVYPVFYIPGFLRKIYRARKTRDVRAAYRIALKVKFLKRKRWAAIQVRENSIKLMRNLRKASIRNWQSKDRVYHASKHHLRLPYVQPSGTKLYSRYNRYYCKQKFIPRTGFRLAWFLFWGVDWVPVTSEHSNVRIFYKWACGRYANYRLKHHARWLYYSVAMEAYVLWAYLSIKKFFKRF